MPNGTSGFSFHSNGWAPIDLGAPGFQYATYTTQPGEALVDLGITYSEPTCKGAPCPQVSALMNAILSENQPFLSDETFARLSGGEELGGVTLRMPYEAALKAVKLGAPQVSHTAASPTVVSQPMPPPPSSAGDYFLVAHYVSGDGTRVTLEKSQHPWILYERNGVHIARADLPNPAELDAAISNQNVFLYSGSTWLNLGRVTSEAPRDAPPAPGRAPPTRFQAFQPLAGSPFPSFRGRG